uniref:Cyclin N-terminal domain-containing protein n=1 Tax=Cryptomonas curvata TaxID=233186 RepID=A0A7S0QDZ1_9CRYP
MCVDGSIGKNCTQLVNRANRAMERNPASPLLSALTSCSLADPGEDFQSPYSRISEGEKEREIQSSLHSSGGSTVTNPTVSNSENDSVDTGKSADEGDFDDGFSPDYVDDIISTLLKTECKYLVSPDNLLKVQSEINHFMRGILVDWMIEVADHFKLAAQTLHLSVNYVDRYLSAFPIKRPSLQLVGITCIFIASKYEENHHRHVEDFVNIADRLYKTEEVFRMELKILVGLEFSLTAVTAFDFIQRLTSLCDMDIEAEQLSLYLAEIALQEVSFIMYRPSNIATSAVILALHTTGGAVSSVLLRRIFTDWGIFEDEIQACLIEMHRAHLRSHSPSRTLHVSYNKFSSPNLGGVSLLVPQTAAPELSELLQTHQVSG